jgi:hypothetical protein
VHAQNIHAFAAAGVLIVSTRPLNAAEDFPEPGGLPSVAVTAENAYGELSGE